MERHLLKPLTIGYKDFKPNKKVKLLKTPGKLYIKIIYTAV